MSDIFIDQSEATPKEEEMGKKIIFPSWRSLTIDSLYKAKELNPEIFNSKFSDYNKIFTKLDLVHSVIKNSDPVNLILFLSEADASYKAQLSFETVFERFKTISVRPNEFYAVFDLYKFIHREVDEKIRDILGLEPEDFNLPAMAGWIPDNPLFHMRDNNHVLRWASIAYYMFTLDLFIWNSMEDQYKVRFRVGMSKSKISYFRERKYVALEKLCFLFYDKTKDGSTKPIYHFDKWLVYDQDEFDFVRPSWISNHSRQSHLNNFLYLINAYILHISPQFLLFLHERQFNDRNKAIAVSFNKNVFEATGIDSRIDEHQVADCFAKTIRNKMAAAINLWDKRAPDDQVKVISDSQAVAVAKTLGLLPIPEAILKLMYENITAI